MRQFTRLTNGFGEKIDNHMHAIALHFMYYNFGRIHKSSRVTPAMEAGVIDMYGHWKRLRTLPTKQFLAAFL